MQCDVYCVYIAWCMFTDNDKHYVTEYDLKTRAANVL